MDGKVLSTQGRPGSTEIMLDRIVCRKHGGLESVTNKPRYSFAGEAALTIKRSQGLSEETPNEPIS